MTKRSIFLLFALFGFAHFATAASETLYPDDWRSWKEVTTPLAQVGAIPGCDADVSGFPPIYQETIEVYCGVKPGGPGKVRILVKPSASAAYKARNGSFADGSNLILHLQDLKLLFLTGHKAGKDVYGVFTEDGKDVTDSGADAPLSAATCRVCHSGYAAFCVAGQCGTEQ